MAGLFTETKDLYGSLWGKADAGGLYQTGFSRSGSSPDLKSYQQRLGSDMQNLGQTDILAKEPIWKIKFLGFPAWIYAIVLGTYFLSKRK